MAKRRRQPAQGPRTGPGTLGLAAGGVGVPGIGGPVIDPAALDSPRRIALAEARALIAKRDVKAAVDKLRPMLYKGRPDPEALFLAGVASEAGRDPSAAAAYAKRSLDIRPHPEAHLLLARCLRVAGETDECVTHCDAALAIAPGLAAARTLKAGALEEAGRFDEAERIIDAVLTEGGLTGTRRLLALDVKAKLHVQRRRYAEALALTDEIIASDDAQAEFKGLTHYVKAKAHDRAREFDAAFAAATDANTLGALDFSPELYERQVTTLIENWSQERMARFPRASCDSELPVFVAGMPRSGTSLIDQIIDAHPRAAGVGELSTIERFAYQLSAAYDPTKEPPRCFGRLDRFRWTRVARDYVRHLENAAPPAAERVVNKALGNNKLVGLIARLFPKTRVIHAIRDPRDVAISCFMGGFNNRLHPWTTRVDWAARAWDQSRRMMEHWKRSLDIPILEVHYERLVADPSREFPRLIEFLGLEWDDRCFEFHKTRRTVRTLSYDQVNRPLYTSSSGRHKNYERFIEGIEFPDYDPWARED